MEDNMVEKAIKLEEEVRKALDKTFVENLIKDNKIIFEWKGMQYRVRLPTYKERQEVNKKRIEKYLELLNTKDSNGNFIYKSEADVRKLYRDRGDDIEIVENEFNNLVNQTNILKEKLGQALTENKADAELKSFKDEIEVLQKRQQELSMKKSLMLELSVENQLMHFVYIYVAFMTTEKNENEQWIRVWNTFEEFENDSSTLFNLATFYATLLTSSEMF